MFFRRCDRRGCVAVCVVGGRGDGRWGAGGGEKTGDGGGGRGGGGWGVRGVCEVS